jgi:hypothetical protein
MPCAGHILFSNQLLGACLRCARWDPDAPGQLAEPTRQNGGTWHCPEWVQLPMPALSSDRPAAAIAEQGA